MKKIFPIVVLFFLNCNSKENNGILKSDINKLKLEVKNLKEEILNLKKWDTKIIISKAHDLIFYDPTNFTIKLLNKRPSINNNKLILCIPAAFTDDPKINHNLIDGHYIENGNIISNDNNPDLSGTCIISKNNIIILSSKNLIQTSNTAVKNKSSLFQQFLLINNYKIIYCAKYDKTPNLIIPKLRRAIVEINDNVFIVESKTQMSILNFQKLLVSNNVKNAIYLDMGTYSEGWYRNDAGKTTAIGETMNNTNKQSNWIVFEKV